MKRLNLRDWRIYLVLAVVVELVVLTVFGLTASPDNSIQIAETATLEPVEWEFEKISFTPEFPRWVESPEDQRAQNFYLNDAVNVTFTYSLLQYYVLGPWYGGGPQLVFRVNFTAGVAEGFVHDVRILFREDYNSSDVYLECFINAPSKFVKTRNLNFSNEWACLWHNEELLEDDLKAFVVAYGFNQPREVEVDLNGIFWILRAEENLSQQLEATAEVTYFNGTDYVKVALPILINLVADAGESFEDARIITAGSYVAGISVFHNPTDCYKMWLAEGQNITIRACLRGTGINMTLCDPSETEMASVKSLEKYYSEPAYMEELSYVTDTDGYWYIKVQSIFDYGLYKLTITVE